MSRYLMALLAAAGAVLTALLGVIHGTALDILIALGGVVAGAAALTASKKTQRCPIRTRLLRGAPRLGGTTSLPAFVPGTYGRL